MQMGRTNSRIPKGQLMTNVDFESLHRIHRSLEPLKLGWTVSTPAEARSGDINLLIEPRIT